MSNLRRRSPAADPAAELRSRFRSCAPGRLQRVFGIHSGRLVACDRPPEAEPEGSPRGRWLYRAATGSWFLLEDDSRWRELSAPEAEGLRVELPLRLDG